MEKCKLIGLEVLTPDGVGTILSLHTKKVVVSISRIEFGQIMTGISRGSMHFAYDYEDVKIINSNKKK